MHHGQEIYTFFNKYGLGGAVGLFLSMNIIGLVIYKTFKIILNNNIKTYQEFITIIMPKKLKQNKILKMSINNIINIFLLISFNIMVAGFATYFLQELNISKWIGAICIVLIAFITFCKNIDGIIRMNTYLIPILIILIIFLGVRKIQFVDTIKHTVDLSGWFINSILYASYNSICLVPILISLKKYVKTKKEVSIISVFTMVIMLILSFAIFLLINTFLEQIKNIELPIVYIAKTLGRGAKYIYGITILIAIFTTAISSGYGFIINVTQNKTTYLIISAIMCICSVFIGQIGFANLINLIYPIFGYLGALQIILILIT